MLLAPTPQFKTQLWKCSEENSDRIQFVPTSAFTDCQSRGKLQPSGRGRVPRRPPGTKDYRISFSSYDDVLNLMNLEGP